MTSSPDRLRVAARIALALMLVLVAAAVLAARGSAAPDVQIAPSAGLANASPLAVTANAPIQSVGPVTQSTTLSWSPASAVLTGPATAPAGWTPEYTTDGTTWSSTLPADPSTVTGARASGPVQSDGVSGGRQSVTTVNNASSVTPPPTFPAAGGGDGYDVFGAPDYLLTVYHHTSPFTMSCFTRATGGACTAATYTKAGYETSYASNGIVIGNKVYAFVRQLPYVGYGVVCTDLSTMPFTDCGYTQLVPYSANTVNPPYVFIGTAARAGTRIYVGIHTGYNSGNGANWASLACFDTATNAPCTGQPYLNGAQTPQPGPNPANYGNVASAASASASTYTSAFADRVFIAGRELWCVNAADGTPCSGWGTAGSPSSVALTGSSPTNPVPMRNASGTVTGVCILAQGGGSTACRNLDGTAATVPAGLTSMITSTPVLNGGLQSYAFGDSRTYWLTPSGPNAYPVCYDWTTGAACASFGSTTAAGQRYTISLDEFDPDCAYTYGNDAVVTTFNARIGGGSCAGGPKMALTAQASVPRLGCAVDTSILAWGSITVTPPGGVTVTAFRVTVRDSQGVPIPGYSDLQPDAQGVVDVSGLPPSASGQSPTITVVATGATTAQANATTITVTRQTDFPQLCLPMQARASCAAALPGSFPGGLASLAPLTLTGTVVETPATGGTSTFPLSGSAARDSLPGCVGGIGGSVKHTDGTAVPGAVVTLKSPDGTVLATTTTSSTGGYSFPANLGPASGYQVVVEGITKSGDVTAGATTTVDFVLPLPAAETLPVQASAVRGSTARPFIDVVVTAPSPGVVAVVGTASVNGARARACTARRSVASAGKVRLRCVLTRPVRVLACRRAVRVTLSTTFTPRAGAAQGQRTQVTVPRARCAAPAVTG